MSKQWGNGYHAGKGDGRVEGLIVSAVVGAIIWGGKKIVEKTGIIDKSKQSKKNK